MSKVLQPRSLKQDKRYKDAPRFPIIYTYEDEFKNSYKTHLNMMMIDLSKEMIKQLKT